MKIHFAAVFALATTVLAHGGVKLYTIDGVQYPGNLKDLLNRTTLPQTYVPDPTTPSIQRRWVYWPIYDLSHKNMTCNHDGAETSPSLHATIAAGSNITAHFDTYLPEPIFPDGWVHGAGPILVYMAACPGETCEGFDGSGAVWFKIAQIGLKPSATSLSGPWWMWDLIGWGTQTYPAPGITVSIPKNLKPGSYLIRHEVIMLASIPAQFYVECAQLQVTGEGTAVPGTEYLASFPGSYKDDDPGIIVADWLIDGGSPRKPEWETTDYQFPGPAVWPGE